MNIHYNELSAVVAELAPLLPGAFLRKVERISLEEWVLHLAGAKQKFRLLIAVSPTASRLHLLSLPLETGVGLDTFGRTLKKRLLRSCLSGVEQINNDRIVAIHFETSEGRYSIVAELMGTRGAFYLTDVEGKVIASAFSRSRSCKLGSLYQPPPPPDGKGVAGADEGDGASPFYANRALEKRLSPVADEERLQRARSGSTSSIKAEQKRLDKRLRSLAVERAKLCSYAEDKMIADLLSAHYHLLKRGESDVAVTDHFNEGVQRVILLDPKLDAAANIARYYKRHRKYEKGLPRLDNEVATTKKKITTLKDELTQIESCRDLKTLLEEKEEIAARKQQRPEKTPPKKGTLPPIGRRFLSSEGYPIIVGRSDKENDQITTRVANGRDVWLHARDYPGSHVLIQLPKKLPLPQKSLEEAGMLALKYSKAAKAGKGEVTWCYAKWVKKPKGFPPGKVLVNDAKSIFVRIDEKVISHLKESR